MSPAYASERRGRVWVSGASGFTGHYVVAALERAGFEVFVPPPPPEFDLRHPETIDREWTRARPEYVIHLAAVSHVAHGRPADFYEVNTVGTTLLLESLAASALPLRKVVVASSANVYGNSGDEPITETTRPAPVNHYAASKLAMESLARLWYGRLPIVVTRPFNYTGVGQSPQFLVPKLVQHFADRTPVLRLGNLDVVRDFSDVRMVATAYCRLLDSQLVGTEVNICSGVGRSLLSIVEALSARSGHSPRIEVDPSLVRSSEVRRLVGTNARLTAAVGALPYTDFEATLAWMLDHALAIGQRPADQAQSPSFRP
jgi:nucleoside-diphosphate-sugar epimerase